MDSAVSAILASLLTIVINKGFELLQNRNDYLEKQAQREHEIQMRKYETLTLPRINAVLKYCEVLGKCMSASSQSANSEALREEYFCASASVLPYVSQEMRNAIAALEVPFDFDFSDDQIQTVTAQASLELQRLTEEISQQEVKSKEHRKRRRK